jgi:hypothetical protein
MTSLAKAAEAVEELGKSLRDRDARNVKTIARALRDLEERLRAIEDEIERIAL